MDWDLDVPFARGRYASDRHGVERTRIRKPKAA